MGSLFTGYIVKFDTLSNVILTLADTITNIGTGPFLIKIVITHQILVCNGFVKLCGNKICGFSIYVHVESVVTIS